MKIMGSELQHGADTKKLDVWRPQGWCHWVQAYDAFSSVYVYIHSHLCWRNVSSCSFIFSMICAYSVVFVCCSWFCLIFRCAFGFVYLFFCFCWPKAWLDRFSQGQGLPTQQGNGLALGPGWPGVKRMTLILFHICAGATFAEQNVLI